LRSSGTWWHKHFADILHDLGFNQCKVQPDIWMCWQDSNYEYIAVYVDNFAKASNNPSKIVKDLEEQHSFILKGTGALVTFH
jgi:hypothetical protein